MILYAHLARIANFTTTVLNVQGISIVNLVIPAHLIVEQIVRAIIVQVEFASQPQFHPVLLAFFHEFQVFYHIKFANYFKDSSIAVK